MFLKGFLLDLLLIFALMMLGALLVRVIAPGSSRLRVLALSFPAGAGILTWTTFLLSWIGMGIHQTALVVTYVALLLILILQNRLSKGDRAHRKGLVGKRVFDVGWGSRRVNLIFGAVILFLFLSASGLAVGRSYSSFDAMSMWATKGYGLAHEASLFQGARWGGHGLAYPLNIPLLISFFRIVSGDLVPGSKLIFPLFYFSGLMFCLSYWIERGVRRELSLAGVILLATVPALFSHATIGYANLPTAVYLAMGTLLVLEGYQFEDHRAKILGGMMLGLASWTIIEGFIYSFTLVGTLFLGWYLSKRDASALRPVAWLVPWLAITLSWLIFYFMYGAQGSQAMSAVGQALASIKGGDWNLTELRILFGYLRRFIFQPDTWGFIFWIGPLIVVLNLRKLHWKNNADAFVLMLCVVSTGVLTLGLFYLRSFCGIDYYAWLQRGFPREFFQTVILFSVLIISLVESLIAGYRQDPLLSAQLAADS